MTKGDGTVGGKTAKTAKKNSRAGINNLKPNSERTPSELREIAKKGGLKSAEKRREQKTMRETFNFIFSMDKIPSGSKSISKIKTAMLAFGFAEEDISTKTILAFSLYLHALEGKSPKYTELVLDIIGEKPSDKLELTGADGTPLSAPEINVHFTHKDNAAES